MEDNNNDVSKEVQTPQSVQPHSPEWSPEKFKTRKGAIDGGRDYETVAIANMVLKLIENKDLENFQVASNADGYGAFDDVILETKFIDGHIEKYLIQLKHVKNKNKILQKESLINNTGNYSLKKYFESFIEINDVSCKVILFTNVKFDYTNFQIKMGTFTIETVKSPIEPFLNTNDDLLECIKFRIVEESDVDNQSEEKDKYKIFFQNFSLYTNQASATQTREIASRYFQRLFTCNDNFEKYMQFIEDWSKHEGTKEKLNATLVKDAVAIRLTSQFVKPLSFNTVHENSKLFRQALSQFNVAIFQTSASNDLQKLWGDCKSKLENSEKVKKLIFRYRLNFLTDDISKFSDLECSRLLWLMDEVPLILVENPVTLKAIELCPNKKFILLREEVHSTDLQNISTFQRLSDLDQKTKMYQEIINTFQCSLQGKEVVSLKSLIEQNENLTLLITTTKLIKMLNAPLVIGEKKEELPDPHINRKLTSCVIDLKFLAHVYKEDQNKTLIVISCRGNTAIKKYLRGFILIDVNSYVKDAPRKPSKEKQIYISIDECSQKEFDEICHKDGKGMKQCHHFRITDDTNLEWIKTIGNIDELEPFRLENHFVEESELYSSQPGNNINIICANPGMGKSTMIKNLKNKLSSQFWTIIVHPTDVAAYFREKNNDFEAFIERKLAKKYTNFDINVMKGFIKKNLIAYIWDGIDEFGESNLKNVIEIIDKLSKKGYIQWITSRCHLKEKLENKFKVFSRTITQFDVIQQETYIRRRLQNKGKDEKEIEDIIKQIKNNIEIIKCHEVLGVPLQIYMLTELFRENTKKYAELLNQIFSLTDLYQHFVQEKFNHKYKERANVNQPNDFLQQILNSYKDSYIKKYEKSALKILLEPEFVEKLNVNCDTFLKKIKDHCDAFGLITEVSDNLMPTFHHNSYAEFFVASYFIKNYDQIPDLKNIIFKERYTNVRFLFDLLLAKNCPTHLAVLYKNKELLTEYKDKLTCKDAGGRSALQVACTWGQAYPLLHTTPSDEEEDTYLINDKLGAFVEQEDPDYQEIIRFLLKNCDCQEEDTLFKLSSLVYADSTLCLFPLVEISRISKFDFETLNNFKDLCSILYYVIRFDYAHIIDVLQDIPLVKTQKRNLSLLHLCAEYNSKNCLKELLATDKYIQLVNAEDEYKVRPISIACKKGYRTIVKMLIDADADLSSVASLLESACRNGHDEIIELLINSAKMNIKSDNRSISTLMHTACLNGYDKIVKYLLGLGVKADVSSKNGSSLYVASQYGHENVVQILIDAGADINKVNKYGSTPLHIACQRNNIEIVKILINSPKVEINAAENKGLTALHSVCKSGNKEIVQLLLDRKANVNLCTKKKVTSLHNACQFGFEEIVAMLIRAGADKDCICDNGFTALRNACEEGHTNVVKLLTELKANIDLRDNKGEAPLDVAQKKGFTEIIELLTSSREEVALQRE